MPNPVIHAESPSERYRRDALQPNLSGRIPELDGLRGLAILMVVLGHYVGSADRGTFGFWVHCFLGGFNAGWSGVDLFFVLSGFLIGGILLGARDAPHYFRTFYMRRVCRILPIYYLWILVYALLVVNAPWLPPGPYQVAPRDLLQVPIQLFFLRNIFIGNMPLFALSWFLVTWSLSVEEQFYLVAPPVIRSLSIRHLVIALAGTVTCAPLLRLALIHYRFSRGLSMAYILTPCRADALAWGILLAIAWRSQDFRAYLETHRAQLRFILLFLFIGVFVLIPWFARPFGLVTLTIGLSWLAVFYSCLLLVTLSQTQSWIAGVTRWQSLRELGKISYCVYLLHFAFNRLAHRILLHDDPEIYNLNGVMVSLLALWLTLAVASLSWRYFEKPLLRLGHRYNYGQAGVN
jgi:peptidoglycan/LPS O-acetylase OafA/YrhL